MRARNRLRPLALALAAFAFACAPAAAATAPAPRPGSEAAMLKALLHSRELWATIDVCTPSDQPNVIGVRGSMPGDRHAHDKMYMRFRLQYMDTTAKHWVDLPSAGPGSFTLLGAANAIRQGGRSFQLVPRHGKPAVSMRGVVEYQWRRGPTVLQTTSRATSAGHRSLAGTDPPGYSAATCSIG